MCLTRTVYGMYFFLGGCFKVLIGLLWSDILQGMFIERLDEIPPDAFAYGYLTQFAIPWAFVVGYVITLGELTVGFLFVKNLHVRWGAVLAVFLTINIGIGGFFSWTLLGFIAFPMLLLCVSDPAMEPPVGAVAN